MLNRVGTQVPKHEGAPHEVLDVAVCEGCDRWDGLAVRSGSERC